MTTARRRAPASRGLRKNRSQSPGSRAPRARPRGRFGPWLLGALVLAAFGWLGLFGWGLLPASGPELAPRRVVVTGTGRREAAETLAAAGLLDSPGLMTLYLAWAAPGTQVAPREHWLGGGRSPRELALALADRKSETARVALPEGGTSFDLAERLERAGVCEGAAFLQKARDVEVLGRLGVPAASAEGYLFPESHELWLDERPERVLAKFVREGQRRLASLIERYPLTEEHRALGLGLREIVILASIVEKETGNPGERSKIARVFLNRLAQSSGETGGRLESDPTAVYGCQALGVLAPSSCTGGVSPALIKDERNPYGTYRRAGLPPGPIGNPGQAALVAVLRPPAGDDLYFVADGLGNHHFSRTFAEHRRAVERLKALRRGATSSE